jgi:hypothetical protein
VHRLFEYVATHACFKSPIDLLIAIITGKGDDLGLGIDLTNFLGGFDAVHTGHPQVHQRDIRMELLEGLHRLGAAPGLGDELHVLFVRQYGCDPFAHQGMIIDT